MKFLKPVLLLILLAGSAVAQVSPATSSAPDVQVLEISWRRVTPNPNLDVATASANAERALSTTSNANQPLVSIPVPNRPVPSGRPFYGFIYEFKVRNTGAKTIRKLVWEYSFTDPGTQRKVGRRQYKSDVKILPGMAAKLVARSSLAPIGTIDAKQAEQNSHNQSSEQMVIERIEYADGSVWQRDSK